MIAFKNKSLGDVLMLIVADGSGKQLEYERLDDVARIFSAPDGETVAWNFFNDQTEGNGSVDLTESQVAELNQKMSQAGFKETLPENKPTLVVAKVVSMEAHPDSDHLKVCQVDVGASDGELVQIVCGSPNVEEGVYTVAALPMTLMPSGKLVLDGALRGIPSHGMLCAPRELALPNAPQVPGLALLDPSLDSVVAGAAFKAEMWHA